MLVGWFNVLFVRSCGSPGWEMQARRILPLLSSPYRLCLSFRWDLKGNKLKISVLGLAKHSFCKAISSTFRSWELEPPWCYFLEKLWQFSEHDCLFLMLAFKLKCSILHKVTEEVFLVCFIQILTLWVWVSGEQDRNLIFVENTVLAKIFRNKVFTNTSAKIIKCLTFL